MSAGKLTQKAAEEIYQKSQISRTSFIAELTGSGVVSAADLAHTVSAVFGAPLLDLEAIDPLRLPKDLLDAKICQAYKVVVLSKRSNRLIVATADPTDQEAAEKIKFTTQMGVDWIIAEYDKLNRLVEATTKSASEAMESLTSGDFEFDESVAEETPEVIDSGANEVEDAPVVKFLQKMLLDAFSMGASDLHFEPYEFTYRVRFRIDGELREIASPPVAIKEKLASRIKVISRMDISEKRIPQDGRMKLKVNADKVIDFRVSTLPTLFGEKIVIRILDPSSARLGIDALGYEPQEKERLLKAIGGHCSMRCTLDEVASHLVGDLFERQAIGLERGEPGLSLALAEPAFPYEARDAAARVAAHFGFAAVGVEHAHARVRLVRLADEHESVRARAEMTVGDLLRKFRRVADRAVAVVDVDVIVACALHLCKTDHVKSSSVCAPRSMIAEPKTLSPS
jgi:type IV pilus assembly protein PilB